MFTLLMNILLWLSWSSSFSGTCNSSQDSFRPAVSQVSSGIKPGFNPGNVKNIELNGIQLKSTIVLEDDTHFRPFFGLKK